MAKDCTLSTGKLPLGGLPRNSVAIRITDCPNMTSAVYHGARVGNLGTTTKLCKRNFVPKPHPGHVVVVATPKI